MRNLRRPTSAGWQYGGSTAARLQCRPAADVPAIYPREGVSRCRGADAAPRSCAVAEMCASVPRIRSCIGVRSDAAPRSCAVAEMLASREFAFADTAGHVPMRRRAPALSLSETAAWRQSPRRSP